MSLFSQIFVGLRTAVQATVHTISTPLVRHPDYHKNAIFGECAHGREIPMLSRGSFAQRGTALVELAVAIGTLTTLCVGLLATSGASRTRLSISEIASIAASTVAQAPQSYITIDTLGETHCDQLGRFVDSSLISIGLNPADFDVRINLEAVDLDSGATQTLRSILSLQIKKLAAPNKIMPLSETTESHVILRPNITPISLGLLNAGDTRVCRQN